MLSWRPCHLCTKPADWMRMNPASATNSALACVSTACTAASKASREAWALWSTAVAGNLDAAEMLRTFNCGIGMVAVVAREGSDAVMRTLAAAG